MTTLEFAVGKKDLLTVQEALSRIRMEDSLLVSRSSREAVYRILIPESRRAATVEALSHALRTFSLRAASKIDGDFLPAEPPESSYALRALNESRDGSPAARRMFGFKKRD